MNRIRRALTAIFAAVMAVALTGTSASAEPYGKVIVDSTTVVQSTVKLQYYKEAGTRSERTSDKLLPLYVVQRTKYVNGHIGKGRARKDVQRIDWRQIQLRDANGRSIHSDVWTVVAQAFRKSKKTGVNFPVSYIEDGGRMQGYTTGAGWHDEPIQGWLWTNYEVTAWYTRKNFTMVNIVRVFPVGLVFHQMRHPIESYDNPLLDHGEAMTVTTWPEHPGSGPNPRPGDPPRPR